LAGAAGGELTDARPAWTGSVELALALALVALLLVIAVDFARIYYVAAVVATASRVAAEYAGTHGPGAPPVAQIKQRARDELGSLKDDSTITTNPDWEDGLTQPPGPGELVTVTVSYTFFPLTPLARSFMPAGKTLTSATLMRRNCLPDSFQVAACVPIPPP
jgi:hypothetical protein